MCRCMCVVTHGHLYAWSPMHTQEAELEALRKQLAELQAKSSQLDDALKKAQGDLQKAQSDLE